jgi:type IV pilus assembly PilN-like protein
MHVLELDFYATRPSSPWVGRALFAVAVVVLAQVGASYVHLQEALDRGEAQLQRAARPAGGAGGDQAARVSPEEMRVARDTVERLSLQWGNLFDALESTPGEDVALLAIEPDTRSGTALISGEGKDYAAALRYVSQLSESESLKDVHLVKHELRPGESRRPLAFSLSAAWKGPK